MSIWDETPGQTKDTERLYRLYFGADKVGESEFGPKNKLERTG